jgi:hypothetical protein
MAAPERALLGFFLVAALGCDDITCPADDSFVVDEIGTCAPAPTRFTLTARACRIFVDGPRALTGRPPLGARAGPPRPVRQGGFMLFGDEPGPFRLCRAERVDFRLELTCVDGQNAPSCNATLTEPGP